MQNAFVTEQQSTPLAESMFEARAAARSIPICEDLTSRVPSLNRKELILLPLPKAMARLISPVTLYSEVSQYVGIMGETFRRTPAHALFHYTQSTASP
jgi:hypothetical protein